MTHLAMLLLSVAGFAALAFATERQQEALVGRLLCASRTRALRWSGAAALLACLCVAIAAWGWGFGLVAFSGHTSLGAGLVYVALLLGARRKTAARS